MDDDYAERIRAADVFVADRDGAVVGLIVLIPAHDHLLIENVAVDPDRQGAGIGRALLKLAEASAGERGLDELRLYTNEAMVENIRLYTRLGYHETGRRTTAAFQRVYFSKRLS